LESPKRPESLFLRALPKVLPPIKWQHSTRAPLQKREVENVRNLFSLVQKYRPLTSVFSDSLSFNTDLAPLLSQGVNLTSLTAQSPLQKLETLTRQPIFMASYLDWAVAAIPKAVVDHNTTVSEAPSEVTRLSSDLVTLSGFVGQIVEDLFSTLNNVAGHTTKMRRGIFLQHLCPALPPRTAVFLRASKFLWPKLFEPGLIQMTQNKLKKRKAQKERSSLVSSMTTVAKAAVKRPQAGQQSLAKRPCHQSKPSASGKAVDTKDKGKPYFPPSSKAKGKGKGKGKKTKSS
jgi:hypothetical protein